MHGGVLCARAVCCVVMRCTVSYSGVPVGVLRSRVVYSVLVWFTVCLGVYCMLGWCTVY